MRRHPSAMARARSFERLVSVATRRHAASFTAWSGRAARAVSASWRPLAVSSSASARVDLLVGCRAERRAGDDELPAQVEVDVESGELDGAVEEAAEHVGVRLRRGDPRERLHELQLRVGAGLGELGERPHGVAGLRRDPLAVLVGEVAADGELEPGEGEAARRGLGLVADAGEHEAHELARGELGIAHRVPRRPEHDRARDGIGELGEPRDGGGERALVEPHLRVGEVVVVHEEQVGLRQADEARARRSTGRRRRAPRGACARARRARAGVAADRDAMRSQGRMRRGGRLLDARRGDRRPRHPSRRRLAGCSRRPSRATARDQRPRSRPLARSSSSSRSRSVALPPACAVRYAPTPRWNASRPTQATSCFSTDAPLS